ncbi:hypothetical protein Ahy_B02g059087 [Arachis hypogaea]|uniref:Uncharacterized protein n=1 Tax=Arachis hypogaea TaxID=3818 RepID=A0A445AG05_ARAHY|nr:hypothetical protein Ahy_B02g059087 [Arachis hypogaea]
MRLLHQRVFRSRRNAQAFEIERKCLFSQLSSANDTRDLLVVISCASLALADVGIMMYDLVASVSVRIDALLFCLGSSERNSYINVIVKCKERTKNSYINIIVKCKERTISDILVSCMQGMQLCLDAYAKLAKIMRPCLKEAASDSQE